MECDGAEGFGAGVEAAAPEEEEGVAGGVFVVFAGVVGAGGGEGKLLFGGQVLG